MVACKHTFDSGSIDFNYIGIDKNSSEKKTYDLKVIVVILYGKNILLFFISLLLVFFKIVLLYRSNA